MKPTVEENKNIQTNSKIDADSQNMKSHKEINRMVSQIKRYEKKFKLYDVPDYQIIEEELTEPELFKPEIIDTTENEISDGGIYEELPTNDSWRFTRL